MIGFHVDMNIGHFTHAYLTKWLRELAQLGYDTIVWEVENTIAWETCPECASQDAFSKEQFRELVRLCEELKLECIPMLQTIAHCEYVLKNSSYKHLAETEGRIDQYCPLHPELLPFLHRWMDEYLELFGNIKYFHIGGDESWFLGACDRCQAYVKKHSLSELYVQHINSVSRPLLEKGIRPILWADMALQHPEALRNLSHDIVLCDWMYDIRCDCSKVWVWGKGLRAKEELDASTLVTFGQFLYPHGDEPGIEPNIFYTADFLTDAGFEVILAPAASSFGDTVFAPRDYFHLTNTFDMAHKGFEKPMLGSILTSWTVQLHPYETQQSCIDVLPYVHAHPSASLESYRQFFVQNHFGTDDSRFLKACGMLSKSCLFSSRRTLGYCKEAFPVPLDHVAKTISKVLQEGRLLQELDNCLARLLEYRQGLDLLEQFTAIAPEGCDCLNHWNLAARNLINRARAGAYLLKQKLADTYGIPPDAISAESGNQILTEVRELRHETSRMYDSILKPIRRKEVLSWIYDSLEHALDNAIGVYPKS